MSVISVAASVRKRDRELTFCLAQSLKPAKGDDGDYRLNAVLAASEQVGRASLSADRCQLIVTIADDGQQAAVDATIEDIKGLLAKQDVVVVSITSKLQTPVMPRPERARHGAFRAG